MKPRALLMILPLLFSSGCIPEPGIPGACKYCVHNGYGSFAPVCSGMELKTFGVVLTGCSDMIHEGTFQLYNPTNVTECRDHQ